MIQTLSALFSTSDRSFYGVVGFVKPTEPD